MYDMMNNADQLSRSRQERLDRYSGYNTWDATISQIQANRQYRLQREMLEEQRRHNRAMEHDEYIRAQQPDTETTKKIEMIRAQEDFEKSWRFYCSYHPQDFRCANYSSRK
jgi:hypothetical protein